VRAPQADCLVLALLGSAPLFRPPDVEWPRHVLPDGTVFRTAWHTRRWCVRLPAPSVRPAGLVNSGLPIHIGAALLGHLNLQTTRGYVAVFNEDVVRHYQGFLDRRRQARPTDEYRPITEPEWLGFEEHFDQRKVGLGGCARPYGTPRQHEHSCLRCPMLTINPKMLPRLDEIEDDLLSRRSRAANEGWLGEVEGLDLTLTFLHQKREQTQRLTRIAPVSLGMPGIRPEGPS
jgi:hypothetical protein